MILNSDTDMTKTIYNIR